MYFETTTRRASLKLPLDNYDIAKKQCSWQTSNSSLQMALQLLTIGAVLVFASTSGAPFDIVNRNEISTGPENLPASTTTEEILPLKEVEKKTTTIAPLTGAEIEPSEQDRRHYIDIFQQWNLSENDYEDKTCEKDMEEELCPADASVSCGSIDRVEQFCKALIGDSNTVRTTKSFNALEGCKIYVSWNHGSCCHSTVCETEYGDDDDEEEPEF